MHAKRWAALAALAVVVAAPGPARADGDDGVAEYMKAARLAMEAQLRIGDILHDDGAYEAAAQAYARAAWLYRGAATSERFGRARFAGVRGPGGKAVTIEVPDEVVEEGFGEIPEEEIVEEPIPEVPEEEVVEEPIREVHEEEIEEIVEEEVVEVPAEEIVEEAIEVSESGDVPVREKEARDADVSLGLRRHASPADVERYRLAQVALRAQLRLAALLRERGDTDAARDACSEAVRLFLELPPPRWTAPPGAPAPEGAVDAALKWLAAHQDVDTDGRWDCDDFMKHDPEADRRNRRDGGGALYDVGVTGLATLAFLGAGCTDRGSAQQNPYARNVRMALRFLMTSQDEDGCFGTRATHSFMYNHAIATLATCEAYRMTRNPRYRKPAQQGLDFIARARNPYMAWRYEPRGGENDTSVTSWCVLALNSGRLAGLEVDPDNFQGALAWIDKMTDPGTGRTGYNYPGGTVARAAELIDRFPADKSEAMTAAGLLTRFHCGQDPRTSEVGRKSIRLLLARPPELGPEGRWVDMYYWLYGTLAMRRVGGEPWARWSGKIVETVARMQHRAGAGARAGSWDPCGAWGPSGGRVYATAMMALCLEVLDQDRAGRAGWWKPLAPGARDR